MPPTIAITGASGKLGGATLTALLAHNLAPASDIVALTSSHPGSATWAALAARGVQVRHATFDDPSGAAFEAALRGVDRFLLVSSPRIALDFGDPPPEPGKGREAHHRVAAQAAARVGVKVLYYTSLAFAGRRAGVMRAHLRTEAELAALAASSGLRVAVLRQGLYSESWPLYLGYFDPHGAGDDAARVEVPLAGDGRVCWTAIADLGLANALILTAPAEDYVGKTVYLATRPAGARSLAEVAALVGRARGGREVRVRIVGGAEHVRYYVEERGRERAAVEWWASTYEALEAGEGVVDDPTLESLLGGVGVEATPVEETIAAMVGKV
ncbi:NAD(P)-binding protein [Xylariaceae sp. FL0662B]|nr:NAD(P)-binding protein [Xylariaceae sp. FL0662B]